MFLKIYSKLIRKHRDSAMILIQHQSYASIIFIISWNGKERITGCMEWRTTNIFPGNSWISLICYMLIHSKRVSLMRPYQLIWSLVVTAALKAWRQLQGTMHKRDKRSYDFRFTLCISLNSFFYYFSESEFLIIWGNIFHNNENDTNLINFGCGVLFLWLF